MTDIETRIRLRLYLGEDKRHGEEALYHAIIRKARQLNLAGATVYRGIEGFGRSTRLHTCEVIASEDLPVVIELIDSAEKIVAFRQLLQEVPGIGVMTCETVEAFWPSDLSPAGT